MKFWVILNLRYFSRKFIVNRKEALKILGFSEDDNPSKRQITIEYRKLALKYHPDKHPDASKDGQKQNEEKFKQLGAAYQHLTSINPEMILEMTDEELEKMSDEKFNNWIYTTNKRLMKDLNQINFANLQTSLRGAILNKDVEYLRKLFSKFKSSKDEQFGDYINKSYAGASPLCCAILFKNTEIIELFLKNGGDPNIEIGEFLLRDSKIKKLLVEYGRIDKSNIFYQLTFAFLAGCTAFAIYSSCDASFVCYAGVAAFALAGVFLVTNAIHDVFYAQTKWPSPNFDEVSTEKVTTNVGLNAEVNSRESGNALA